VVFVCVPKVLLVTLTEIVQLDDEPTLAPVTVIVEVPATAVTEASVQLEVMDGMLATVIADGIISVKAKFVTPVPEAVLSIVKIKVLILPGPIVLGLKALVKPGCPFVFETNRNKPPRVRSVFLNISFIG
jgi:hypothetical protein